MFVQTEHTPNPNTLKFLPGKKVSEVGNVEFKKNEKSENKLIRELLSVKEVDMIFLGSDFITVKKTDEVIWEKIKPSIISLINEYYLGGNESVLKENYAGRKDKVKKENYDKVSEQIIDILESKVTPAVARDGGDIKFKSFKDGTVTVELRGSCSGCPSSIMTLKQGVENLLRHYVPEVKKVEAE